MKKPFNLNHLVQLLGCLLVLNFSIALSCSGAFGSESREFGSSEYRVPLGNEPQTLDPAYITDIYSVNVAMNLFDGLVEFNENLEVVPSIARRWIISRDHRIYTFYLRDGARFHNGRNVTAEDFVYSIRRILDPEIKSPVASLFLNIAGAKAFNAGKSKEIPGLSAPDPLTFRMELEEPFAPMLSILAMANAKVVPKEAVGPDFGKKPVGTGPFRFLSWEQGHAIVLVANKDYFAEPPQLSVLRFRIYLNDPWELIFADFEKKLLDQAIIPKGRYEEVVSNSGHSENYQFLSSPGLNLVYVGMNGTMPPLNDTRVRQAIAHAVDTEAIVTQVARKGSIPAWGVLPPGVAGSRPDFKGLHYDVRKARELLAQAGYPEGRGIPPLELWTVSKDESVQEQLNAYKRYLGAIGIQVIPKVAENWKQFVGLINEKKVPMFYAAWYADYPDADNFLYVLCHSQSVTNRMGYRNPKVDALLDQARREMDYMKRVQMYQEAELLVMQDAPIICQHVNTFNCLFQPWVQGVQVNYLGPAHIAFRKVRIDQNRGGEKMHAEQAARVVSSNQ